MSVNYRLMHLYNVSGLRLIDPAIAKEASRNLVKDVRQSRAFLFDGNGMVHMLVTQVLNGAESNR
jgi:hypothetical protein